MALKHKWLVRVAMFFILMQGGAWLLFRILRSRAPKRCRCENPLFYPNYKAMIATHYNDTVNCSADTAPVTFMGPDDDWRPAEVKHVGRIPLCFVLGGLHDVGGVESWFWSLYDTVFNQPPFYVYGVRLVGPRTGHPILRLAKDGVRHNPSEYDIIKHCSIVLQTGSPPIANFARVRLIPRVMVVHGGAGDAWTLGYTKFALHYDTIVSVSPNGLETVPQNFRSTALIIPAGIPKCKGELTAVGIAETLKEKWGVPLGKKVLMYLGRITWEKKLQYFVDVVMALPENWMGVMVGPMVTDIIKEEWRVPQLVIIPEAVHSGDALQVADVLINPSPAEGGPLVLLEAWSAKKPMFMRPTGWATEYPDAVFTIKEGDSPSAIAQVVQDVAQAMEQGEGYPAAVVKRGKKIFQDRFSLEVVAKKWAATLLETLNKKQRTVERIEVPLNFTMPLHGFDETVGIQKCLHSEDGPHDAPLFRLKLGKFLDWPLAREVCATLTIDFGVEYSTNPNKAGLIFVQYLRGQEPVVLTRHTMESSHNQKVRPYHQRAYFSLRLPPKQEVRGLSLMVMLSPGTHVCIETVVLGRASTENCIDDLPPDHGGREV